jgi:hypothetical protein
MPRRFRDTAMQAGYTAHEFAEPVTSNPFMNAIDREKFEHGYHAFRDKPFADRYRARPKPTKKDRVNSDW